MALAFALTVGFCAIWGYWTWQRESAQLRGALSREGRMLVSAMAIPIINALLYEELGIIEEGGLLDNFVADIMKQEQLSPVYAVILDRGGRVLAHNDLTEYGKIYRDSITLSAMHSDSIRETQVEFEGRKILDFAAPLAIGGKRWGLLRMGVSQQRLEQELRSLAAQLLTFTATFALGSLVVYFAVGHRLARPLQTLARQMEEVKEEALPYRPTRVRGDEIGELQKSFSYMMERLLNSEKARQQAQQILLESERLATIGMIVSGVAHEVNNPLAGIQSALYNLERKGGPEVGRYTRLIGKEVERISKILGQLLDLSRSGAVQFETVESRAFFQELSLFAQMALKGRALRFEAQDLAPACALHLDRDKIHQVILNLILNAADAAGDSGQVVLRAEMENGWYCLEVSDNGPGVPAALRERIFESFFTTKEPGKGTGMGLALSKSIAESHGGRLELLPPHPQGATFVLKIPLKDRPS